MPEQRYHHIEFSPPEQARKLAKRGLELRREYGRGGTLVGVARARDISNGKRLSRRTIARMVSFFARHNTPREQSARNRDKTSNAYISWLLWGGDVGRDWAVSVWKKIQSADESKAYRIYKSAISPRVFRGDDGTRYMLLIAATGYKDRENEWIPTDSMRADTEERWDNDTFVGKTPLMFWHDDPDTNPEAVIGEIIWADMHDPFLVEVAKEKSTDFGTTDDLNLGTSYSKGIWDYIENNPDTDWGASIGFTFLSSQKSADDTSETYGRIYKFETSVLPLDNASNPYTFAEVIDMKSRDTILNEIFGEDAAPKIKKVLDQKKSALAKSGVQHKSLKRTRKDDSYRTALSEDDMPTEDELTLATEDQPVIDEEEKAEGEMMSEEGMSDLTPESAAQEALTQINAAATDEEKLQILERLIAGLLEDEPMETYEESEVVEEQPDALLDDSGASVDIPDEEDETMKSVKTIEFYRSIVEAQKVMANDIQVIVKSIKELNRRQKSNSASDAVAKLGERVKRLEKERKLTPRIASRDVDTVVKADSGVEKLITEQQDKSKLNFFTS